MQQQNSKGISTSSSGMLFSATHDMTSAPFTSLSAGTLESILPVQFEDENLEKDYSNVFYPRRKPGRGYETSRQLYAEIFAYMGEVSALVNATLSQIRWIYLNLPIMESNGTPKEGIESQLMRAWEDNQKGGVGNVDDYVRSTMAGAATGRMHIIRPSDRYKGGQDVLFSGVPNTGYGGTSTVFVRDLAARNMLPTFTSELSDVVKASDVTDLCMRLASGVNAWLLGTSNVVKGDRGDRLIRQVRIGKGLWDVEEMMKSLNTEMRAAGFRNGFGKLWLEVDRPKGMDSDFAKYFSFLVVREPDHAVLDARAKRPGMSDEDSPVLSTRSLLQAEYGLSFAMNLPEQIVSFVTQTPKGGRIPLASLNTWVNAWARALIRAPRTKVNRGSGDRITVGNVPRYILLPSATKSLEARRKELGLFTEAGRVNEDSIFISSTGRFNYCPPASDVASENARSYERLQEEALEVSFNAGSPLIASQTGYASPYFAQKDETYRDKIRGLKADLGKYAGSLQTYSWDYNCILHSSASDPDRLVSIPLTGAIKPDSLALSEYLTKPTSEALSLLLPSIQDRESRKALTDGDLKSFGPLLDSNVFESIQLMYQYLLFSGKVPPFQTLLTRAAKALDYTSLDPSGMEEDSPARYEVDLYNSANRFSASVIDNSLKPFANYAFKPIPTDFEYDRNDPASVALVEGIRANLNLQSQAIIKMLRAALNDAQGTARSNIMRINISNSTAIDDDEHYFDMGVHNLGEFSNIYNYLGGRVFYELLQALLKVNPKDLMVVDTKNPFSMPSFASVVKEVMPMVMFLGKYAPDSERIITEGEEISEGLKKDTSITTDDINLPGSKEGFQMFPHQAESFQSLGNHPKFAVLDIAPGGGKTILGLTDIGNLIHKGLIKRPVVLCPNGLVRNWIEDMHSVTDGKWNLIPLTTATYRTWGDERLTKMIQNAPPNTIVVVGLSFLRLQKYQVVIGNHVESVSGTLEFCKKFGFDYVILDESHKAKNMRSHTHKAIKQLTVSSAVKYVRIATGTLIQTKLTDVVGQAALMGSHIFRTQEEYEAENSVPAGSGRAMVFASDTPYRARRQLAKHSAVISFKRKEWAFMLPRPIETFISVHLDAEGDEVGAAHQMMYEAVLKTTLDEIRADKSIMAMLSGKGDDGEADDSDDASDDDESPEATYARAGAILGSGEAGRSAGGLPTTTGDDLDDASLEELEQALQPYLARLEQMLTDPLGDAFGAQYFKGMNKGDYVSRKVKKVIERIRRNFDLYPWERSKRYKLKDITDYNGQRYVLMGEPGKKLTLESYEEMYQSDTSPDKDPRWKPEPYGKVIVFCRFTRSVNAIYRALPPDLQKIAVKFSGEESDKWQNLETFRTTPFSKAKGVQIFIANEQAISEGHNLQMASRIVRVESPWSPGELDQSSSRIFRPDTTGEFRRENIYLDWVLCNNTLEVAKLGRLVSRMIDKAKFDEADNPLYDSLADLELPPISMSMETIAATPLLQDISEYVDGYQQLVRIQSAEFEELRQTKPNVMFDIAPTEMPEGSAILEQVPYLPTLKRVPDRHGFGLVKLTTFMQDSDSEDAQALVDNKQKLVGMYVHTEMGNGVVTGVRELRSRGDEPSPSKLSSVTVQLVSGDTYTGDPAMIYLAQNLTKDNVASFTPKNRWATNADKKKSSIEERKRERLAAKEEARLAKQAKREERQMQREEKLRKADEEAKKKLKAGKKPVARSQKAVEEPEADEEEATTLELYPVIYNGYMAVEATAGEEDAKLMKRLGFKNFGDYAYVQIKDKISFDATLAWLNKKFYLRSETRRRLEKLAESFVSGRGRKFQIELAPLADFKNFYNISHKLSGKDKDSGLPELKVYPVIIDGALFLNVDVSTNPIIRKYVNKLIPGTKNVKFAEADGLWIQFFNTRNDVVRWVKEIRADGIQIENMDEFKTRVDELKDKLRVMQKMMK